MGLLDLLNSGQSANGGLLSFLNSLGQAGSSQMGPLPSDQAQYGQPPVMPQNAQPGPLGSAPAAGPMGAPSQANAQMIPQQPPAVIPAQPMQAPTPGTNPVAGFFNRIGDGLQSVAQGGTLQGAITGHYTDHNSQQGQAQNLTVQALKMKGVDPAITQAALAQAAVGNAEPLKTLWETNFKAKDPMNLGGGYVLPAGASKAIRMYEPDEKTPAGFATDDKGMHYVPGGPADPAYQRLVAAKAADPNAVFTLGRGGELYKKNTDGTVEILHKNEAETPEATLDDKTAGAMAAQYLAGDKSVMQNLGRGAQGAANIVKLRTEIYNQAAAAGLDGKTIVNNFNEQAGNLAGQRSIGTRAANISLAANEANNMIPIALDASAKVPRGEWMPWNKMVQAYQTGTSSPELARFVAATNSLVNSYVRAVSPSGVPTDSMREHAYSMLNSAQSPQAYQAVTSIMQDEMNAAMKAPGQVRKELRHEDTPAAEPAKPDQGAIEAEMKRRGLLK